MDSENKVLDISKEVLITSKNTMKIIPIEFLIKELGVDIDLLEPREGTPKVVRNYLLWDNLKLYMKNPSKYIEKERPNHPYKSYLDEILDQVLKPAPVDRIPGHHQVLYQQVPVYYQTIPVYVPYTEPIQVPFLRPIEVPLRIETNLQPVKKCKLNPDAPDFSPKTSASESPGYFSPEKKSSSPRAEFSPRTESTPRSVSSRELAILGDKTPVSIKNKTVSPLQTQNNIPSLLNPTINSLKDVVLNYINIMSLEKLQGVKIIDFINTLIIENHYLKTDYVSSKIKITAIIKELSQEGFLTVTKEYKFGIHIPSYISIKKVSRFNLDTIDKIWSDINRSKINPDFSTFDSSMKTIERFANKYEVNFLENYSLGILVSLMKHKL